MSGVYFPREPVKVMPILWVLWDERHSGAVLDDSGETEGSAVHHQPDAGLEQPAGQQGLGHVLNGIGVAELVRPDRARQDDWLLDVGQMGVQVVAG